MPYASKANRATACVQWGANHAFFVSKLDECNQLYSFVQFVDQRDVAVVRIMNRIVRRCFLMGDDPVSGKNFAHRKIWVENELKRLDALAKSRLAQIDS